MSSSASKGAVRTIVCIVLLMAATAAGVADRRRADAAAARNSIARVPPPPPLTYLSRSVHPAADAMFGRRWSASRNLIMPVAGVTRDELVDTFEQLRGPNRRHEAIDIPAPGGTPVLAVTDGEILRLTHHDSGGISLYLLAPDGRTMFYYAHLLRYADEVRAGMPVRQGDVIGHVGDTGNAGPGNHHLHFEVMTAPDPRQYQAARPRNPYPLLLRSRG